MSMQRKLSWALLAITILMVLFPVSVLAGPFGYEESDFCRIATGGFGDAMNNYAWSMAQFKGDLYVGTGRNNPYMLSSQFPGIPPLPAFTHPDGAPGSLEWAEDMRAEIWRLHDGTWERVFQSDIVGAPGNWAPKYWGLRGMATFTDCGGETLYVTSRGITSGPGHLLLKSTDGTSWQEVVTPPEMGSQSRAIGVHNGRLYIGTGADLTGAGIAQVWAAECPSDTTDNWTLVADLSAIDADAVNNTAVIALQSFNGYLYAGTQNQETGYQVFRSTVPTPTDPILHWTRVVQYGAGDMSNYWAGSMKVFQGKLYVGSLSLPVENLKGFELIRISPDDSWELLVGDLIPWQLPPGGSTARIALSGWPGGFGNLMNLYCWSLEEKDGVLYLGTFDAGVLLTYLPPEWLASLMLMSPEQKAALVDGIRQMLPQLPEELGSQYEELANALEAGPIERLQLVLRIISGADMWKSVDGVHWLPVTLDGFDNPNNYGIRTMLNADTLYVGTANPFEGLEVLSPCPPQPSPTVVGVDVMPVDKAGLLGLWIVIFAGIALAIGTVKLFAGRIR